MTLDPWVQQAKLMPGDVEEEDVFGSSVALDGDTALVGAPYNVRYRRDGDLSGDCFGVGGLSITVLIMLLVVVIDGLHQEVTRQA